MEVVPASESGIARAKEVLLRGGTVIHPTETCYGIACDLTNLDAVKKLFDIKKRPYNQPVSALFASIQEAETYAVFSPKARELAEKCLPGPLTIVLPRRKDAPDLWLIVDGGGKDPWIGVRISSHPIARALAEAMKRPIATTSANLHGQGNPYTRQDIEKRLKDGPDLFLYSGALPMCPVSTVVRVSDEDVLVLRQGSLKL